MNLNGNVVTDRVLSMQRDTLYRSVKVDEQQIEGQKSDLENVKDLISNTVNSQGSTLEKILNLTREIEDSRKSLNSMTKDHVCMQSQLSKVEKGIEHIQQNEEWLFLALKNLTERESRVNQATHYEARRTQRESDILAWHCKHIEYSRKIADWDQFKTRLRIMIITGLAITAGLLVFCVTASTPLDTINRFKQSIMELLEKINLHFKNKGWRYSSEAGNLLNQAIELINEILSNYQELQELLTNLRIGAIVGCVTSASTSLLSLSIIKDPLDVDTARSWLQKPPPESLPRQITLQENPYPFIRQMLERIQRVDLQSMLEVPPASSQEK